MSILRAHRPTTDHDLPDGEGGIRPRRGKASWVRPVLSDFYSEPGQVLCFDQTVTNTGVAILRYDPDCFPGLVVDYTAMLRPPKDDLKSHEATYARARAVHRQIEAEVAKFRIYASNPRKIIGERPAVTGHRTESCFLAGYALSHATGGQAELVSNIHAKAVLLGPKAKGAPAWTKADVKRAVEHYVLPPDPGMPWNEHVRDAIMLGLAHMFDEKKAAAR